MQTAYVHFMHPFYVNYEKTSKSVFTCNRDKISSGDETHPGMKKFLFTREFHPAMEFNLKENLSLNMENI